MLALDLVGWNTFAHFICCLTLKAQSVQENLSAITNCLVFILHVFVRYYNIFVIAQKTRHTEKILFWHSSGLKIRKCSCFSHSVRVSLFMEIEKKVPQRKVQVGIILISKSELFCLLHSKNLRNFPFLKEIESFSMHF